MNVPKLRFPEFSGEWITATVGSLTDSGIICAPIDGNHGEIHPKSSDYVADGIPFVMANDIRNGKIDYSNTSKITEKLARTLRKGFSYEGDVLLTHKGTVGEVCLVGKIPYPFLMLTPQVTYYRLKNCAELNNEFLATVFETQVFQKRLALLADGGTRAYIGITAQRELKVPYPSLPEQKKIAAFLGVVDAKIAALRELLAGLERYKQGVMQALLSQTLRFTKPDGTPFPDWEERRLGEVLNEHKLKSTGIEKVFSVSVHKGLINQIEHLGRSFSAANTDHYNRVLNGDIVYTKSPTGDFPLGIIKQSQIEEDVIVSPLYGVFTPQTSALGRILHVHFESHLNVSNYLSPIVQKGAKNTINVTNSGFLSNKLALPVSHDEQQKISDALTALDAKIGAVAVQVAQMETFKKGLLQQMFV